MKWHIVVRANLLNKRREINDLLPEILEKKAEIYSWYREALGEYIFQDFSIQVLEKIVYGQVFSECYFS